MIKIRRLQTRLILLVILPVAIFLSASGFMGYFYVRDVLLKEWQEVAMLRLERAAQQMDTRLQAPLQWLESLAQADNQGTREWIIQQLRNQPGVRGVSLAWRKTDQISFKKIEKVSPPQYSYPPGQKTVAVKAELLGRNDELLGEVEVLVGLDYLMQEVLTSGWLQSYMACLVDVQAGQFLAHTDPAMASRHCLGDTQDPLELAMFKAMKEKPAATLVDPGYFPDQVVGFHRLQGAPWAIMLHAQARRIMAPILNFRFYYLVAGILCLAVILALIRLGIGPTLAAIRRLSQKAVQVARGEYGAPLPLKSHDEIGRLTAGFNDMVAGLKERDFISNTFGRYVDPEIARQLLSRPEAARMGGEKRQVAILFADLRDFTPLAETLSPEATIHLVNRFFSAMIEVIQDYHGIIVDFLGDAILAFFDPLDGPPETTLRQALKCALTMQQAMVRVNLPEDGFPPLFMGIGLHAGEVVVGNVGSEARAKYGIVGSAVNLTHRIQAQAKGGAVVVSQEICRQLKESLELKRSFTTKLKGVHEPMTLHVVQGLRESL